MKQLGRFALVFFLIIALSRPFFAFSDEEDTEIAVGGNKEEVAELSHEIEAKKEKIKQIEQSIEGYKKKIELKKTEAMSLSNQLGILDNKIGELELTIERTETLLEQTKLELEQLNLEIEDKSTLLAKQQEILAELIRTLGYEQNKKYIEVIVAYDSFSDFYSRVVYLENLEKNVGRQVKSLRLTKQDLEKKHAYQKEREKTYKKLTEELEQEKQDIEDRAEVKEVLLVQAEASQLEYKTLIGNLKQQYQQIEGEISSIERKVRAKLEKEDKLPTLSESDESPTLSWPVNSRYITAYFYDPTYPYRNVFEHNAIDIAVAQGTQLRAAGSGYVGRAKVCSVASCYSYVMIVHAGGISTVYGHMSAIYVSEGQFVTRGDAIGLSGGKPGTIGAGNFTTGAHLHFEVRKDGIPVNPLNYLGE